MAWRPPVAAVIVAVGEGAEEAGEEGDAEVNTADSASCQCHA